jgi:hypothetical protein
VADDKEEKEEREERFRAIQRENERLKRESAEREKLDEIRAEVERNEAHRKALWDSAIEEKHKNNEAAIWGLVGLLVVILIGILSEM